ncbi:hypothetical protein [Microbulbifer aggregans]|uniref:hypothetical protein n=1 Tax=Microbulbifer aggregans TaxID=1769779 RepID=UPI001CFEBDCA|nr:hypothetical protein [Microbulbifer aggregans]
MGDIARHRNIYFNTRDTIPRRLLDRASIRHEDLTYIEYGNFLTDVSQFRDPVWYIIAKRTIWKENVLPGTGEIATPAQIALAALGGIGAVASQSLGKSKIAAANAIGGVLGAAFSPQFLAELLDLDDWLNQMLGVPLIEPEERRRTNEEFGFVGEFFRHFIEGITLIVFSDEATEDLPGTWGQIDPISASRVSEIYTRFFTQYYPHEHTDQPPYVWDASKRPQVKKWYGVSRRQKTLTNESGIMAAVDNSYIPYLSDGLSDLEAAWRKLKPSETDARQILLVRLGKILHGVEDWFFHSNVVELNRLVTHTPQKQDAETNEAFVRRFVLNVLELEELKRKATPRREPAPTDSERKVEFQRRLFRRLHYPVYDPGTREHSGGTPSKKPATLNLEMAYPAFPSQQDTAHTLLGALENLEAKFHRSDSGSEEDSGKGNPLPSAVACAVQKFIASSPGGRELYRKAAQERGVTVPHDLKNGVQLAAFAATVDREKAKLIGKDVLREWMPLVLTLMFEDERERLAANVPPLLWPLASGAKPPEQDDDAEMDAQLQRHEKALQSTKQHNGKVESGYKVGMRFLQECGMIGPASRQAMDKAFEVDAVSEKSNKYAPGAGGLLMQFAVKLQKERDESDKKITAFNKMGRIFDNITQNGANDEIIGSHSLMSKDTVDASPFFDDARVMASVASLSVLHIFLDEVSSPSKGTVVDWLKVLRHLIRFPRSTPGWEQKALAHFKKTGKPPKFNDIPDLERLGKGARIPASALKYRKEKVKQRAVDAKGLEVQYILLERIVANFK